MKKIVETIGNFSSANVKINGYKNAHDEVANVTIDTSVSYNALVQKASESIKKITPQMIATETGIDVLTCATAIQELTESFKDTINNGAGKNAQYYHSAENKNNGVETYQYVSHGVKIHTETGILHIEGVKTGKEIITKGVYKEKKSQPKTIAKEFLRKELGISDYCQYKLDGTKGNFESISVDGRTFESKDFV